MRQHFNANLDNLRLTDEQVAADEIQLFKHAGGSTVIDPTPKTLARDPLALARIARATGLNVVMGSGYYVAASHPPDMDGKSVDALADEMIADVTVGAGDTGVRAGLLGEIGTTYPLSENERKVLQAAVAAQRQTGAPLMVHPGGIPGSRWCWPSSSRGKAATWRARSCATSTDDSDVRAVIDLAQTGIWLDTTSSASRNATTPITRASTCRTTAGAWRTSWR